VIDIDKIEGGSYWEFWVDNFPAEEIYL